MLRNMPTHPDSRTTEKVNYGLAMADVIETSGSVVLKYSTPLVQQKGRWTIGQLFFARDFVWMPQLAWYKRIRNLPLGTDEKTFMTLGFSPFQQRARSIFTMTGYTR